jgi:hypothetical protein
MSAINQINNDNDKGVVLLMVLSTIFIVVILASVVLTLITSQSRLTHHQVSRIQAYYAAQAGMNYAIEMLRLGPGLGGWSPPATGTVTYTMCRSSPPLPDCSITENNFLPRPFQVNITIGAIDSAPPGPAPAMPGTAPISAAVDYAYTP